MEIQPGDEVIANVSEQGLTAGVKYHVDERYGDRVLLDRADGKFSVTDCQRVLSLIQPTVAYIEFKTLMSSSVGFDLFCKSGLLYRL
jgi:hypothetical protein